MYSKEKKGKNMAKRVLDVRICIQITSIYIHKEKREHYTSF